MTEETNKRLRPRMNPTEELDVLRAIVDKFLSLSDEAVDYLNDLRLSAATRDYLSDTTELIATLGAAKVAISEHERAASTAPPAGKDTATKMADLKEHGFGGAGRK